jgi:metal-responsive CopG/Arc/MetJ family transcriptional regulator
MPKRTASTTNVVITVRLPAGVNDELNHLLATKRTDYSDRSDFLRCAIRKEVEYQRKKSSGLVMQSEG